MVCPKSEDKRNTILSAAIDFIHREPDQAGRWIEVSRAADYQCTCRSAGVSGPLRGCP